MTSTASLLSAGEILKQDSVGRVRTPLAKRQEILAAFDGSGMSAARFAAMVGINYSTFCSWVQECNQKQRNSFFLLTRAVSSPAEDGAGEKMESKNLFGSSAGKLVGGTSQNLHPSSRGPMPRLCPNIFHSESPRRFGGILQALACSE
jgi:hypothetical protein